MPLSPPSSPSLMGTGNLSFSYTNVLGPYLLGVALECFGMGIVLVQSLTYLNHRPSLPSRKAYILGGVIVLLVLNSLQTALDVLRVYAILVKHFGDILFFVKPRTGDEISQVLSTLIAFLCQSTLLHRTLVFLSSLSLLSNLSPSASSSSNTFKRVVFSRTGRAAYTTLMGGMIVLAAVTGIMTGYGLSHSGSLIGLGRDAASTMFNTANKIWLISSSAIDIVLAVVFSLELKSSRSAFAQTNSILRRLALLVLGSGILTTIIQLTAMLLQMLAPGSAASGSWCYLPILPLSKVYTISLLVSLNSGQNHASSAGGATAGTAATSRGHGSDSILPITGAGTTTDQPWWPVRERKAGGGGSSNNGDSKSTFDQWSEASSFVPIIRNYETKEYTPPPATPSSYILPPPATKSRVPRVIQVEVFRRPLGSRPGSARSSFEAV